MIYFEENFSKVSGNELYPRTKSKIHMACLMLHYFISGSDPAFAVFPPIAVTVNLCPQ